MKKTIRILMLVALVIFGISLDHRAEPVEQLTVAEHILKTVVSVNKSSGVIIYSDEHKALVLTAYHTIEANCNYKECDLEQIEVLISHEAYLNPDNSEMMTEALKKEKIPEEIIKMIVSREFIKVPEIFKLVNIEVDKRRDLAIIEIETPRKLEVAELIKYPPKVGDPIYIGANPQRMFRSLNSGIISSVMRYIKNIPSIQISGGIVFGSSGGGVFTTDGELLAIVQSVRMAESPYCYDQWNEDGQHTGTVCVQFPAYQLGFATQPSIMMQFLINSSYCEDLGFKCSEDNTNE